MHRCALSLVTLTTFCQLRSCCKSTFFDKSWCIDCSAALACDTGVLEACANSGKISMTRHVPNQDKYEKIGLLFEEFQMLIGKMIVR